MKPTGFFLWVLSPPPSTFSNWSPHTDTKIALTGSQSTSDVLATEMGQAFTIASRKQFFTRTPCALRSKVQSRLAGGSDTAKQELGNEGGALWKVFCGCCSGMKVFFLVECHTKSQNVPYILIYHCIYMKQHTSEKAFIYIYSFSRRFYPKRLTIDLSVSPTPLSYCCSRGQTNGVAHCLTMTAAVWKPCPTMFLHNFGHRI